jgi:hypothetical protein
MLRDARTIGKIYLENTGANVAANSLLQTKATSPTNLPTPTATSAAVPNGGNISAGVAPAQQSNEEKKLPSKHWVKVEKIVKDDVKEVENLAHEIAMLIHSCCDTSEVTSKVMSKIFKKHRAWSKKK